MAYMTIPDHFIPEFEAAWKHMAQQKDSRLAQYVSHVGGLSGEIYYFNQIAPTEAIEVTGQRLAKTVRDELDTDRRAMHPHTISKTLITDPLDPVFLGKCALSTSDMLMAHAMAHARMKDKIIIEAAYGPNNTGRHGENTVNISSDHTIAHGSTGLTLSKLQDATRILEEEMVIGPDLIDMGEEKIILINARMKQDLLEDDHLTNNDYNDVRLLVAGKLGTFYGFKFVLTEMLPTDSSGNPVAIAYVKSGLKYGTWTGYKTRVSELPDVNYAVQTWTQETFGACRTEEKKFVLITCQKK